MSRIVTLLLLFFSLSAQAEEQARTADQVLDCAAQNNPDKTFRHEMAFTTTNAEGTETILQTRILGERADSGLLLNLRVIAPPPLAKTTILVRERDGQDDMRIFIPAAHRTQRVTGSMAATKLLGTDFSYQDLKQMFGALLDGQAEYLEEADLDGRKVDRLKLVPLSEEAAPYDQVLVAFDRQACVVLEALFKTNDGQLLRTMKADVESLALIEGHNYIGVYEMKDLVSQTSTRVELGAVEYDERLPSSTFHPVSFNKVD